MKLKLQYTKNNNADLVFNNIRPDKINFLIANNGRGKSLIADIIDKGTSPIAKLFIDEKQFSSDEFNTFLIRLDKKAQCNRLKKFSKGTIVNPTKTIATLSKKYGKKDIFTNLPNNRLNKIVFEIKNDNKLDGSATYSLLDFWNKFVFIIAEYKPKTKGVWFSSMLESKNPSIEEFLSKTKNNNKSSHKKTITYLMKSLKIDLKTIMMMIQYVDKRKFSATLRHRFLKMKIQDFTNSFNNIFPALKNSYKIEYIKNKVKFSLKTNISKGQTDLIYNFINIQQHFLNIINQSLNATKTTLIILDETFDFLDQSNILFIFKTLWDGWKEYFSQTENHNIYYLVTSHLDPSIFYLSHINNFNIVLDKQLVHDCLYKKGGCHSFLNVEKWRKDEENGFRNFHITKTIFKNKNKKVLNIGLNSINKLLNKNQNINEKIDICPIAISYYMRLVMENEVIETEGYSQDYKKNYWCKKDKNFNKFIKDCIGVDQKDNKKYFDYQFISGYVNTLLHIYNEYIDKKRISYFGYAFNSEATKAIIGSVIKKLKYKKEFDNKIKSSSTKE